MRKTKVIATIGSASDKNLEQLIINDVDAILIDNYFGNKVENKKRIENIKEYAKNNNKNIAIIYDLDHIYADNKYKLIRLDYDNISFALEVDVDYIACPFVNGIEEIKKVKSILENKNSNLGIIVKIDSKEAYLAIDEILEIADSIMINRDELGMDFECQDVPAIQKEIIKKANVVGKPVILTTQMLHSMIFNPRPTRSEVSDVANAIIDGVDCVMLVEETAIGSYPLEALETVSRIIKRVESSEITKSDENDLEVAIESDMKIAHAVSLSAKYLIECADVKNIVSYTKSGTTAKFISKYRPSVPVLAVVPNSSIARKLSIVWGIMSVIVEENLTIEDMLLLATKLSKESKLANTDDNILVTAGDNKAPTDFLNIRKVD